MRILTFFCASMLLASSAPAALIISELVDGDLPGGNPKFVEITNTSLSDYTFTGGGLLVLSNGATDLTVDVPLTGVTIPAISSFVIASDANDGVNQFLAAYGFAADLYTPVFFGNGDDGYAISLGNAPASAGDLADIYGDFGVDGTGTVWEYVDSYAFRSPLVNTGSGGSFESSEWIYGGNAALDAPLDPARIALLTARTTPGVHVFPPIVPEPGTAVLAMLSLAAAGAVTMRSRLG